MSSLLSTRNGFFRGLGIWDRKYGVSLPFHYFIMQQFLVGPSAEWACILFIVSGRCPGFRGLAGLRGAFRAPSMEG